MIITPLTKAQISFIETLHMLKGVVQYRKTSTGRWRYFLASAFMQDTTTNFQVIITSTNTIKALIAKQELLPKISDEEFAIQLALGTTDQRTYFVPYLRWKELNR